MTALRLDHCDLCYVFVTTRDTFPIVLIFFSDNIQTVQHLKDCSLTNVCQSSVLNVLDGSVSLSVSCQSSVIAIINNNSSSSRRRRRRRRTAAEERAQLRTKLFASDQVGVEVIRVRKERQSLSDEIALIQGLAISPEGSQPQNGRRSEEQDVDERSDDDHDGGHGGVGRG